MLLVPTARTARSEGSSSGAPARRSRSRTETAIEAPYRMSLSPALDGAGEQFWRNRTIPLMNDGRTELWHTRLVNLYCLDDLCTPGDSEPQRRGDARERDPGGVDSGLEPRTRRKVSSERAVRAADDADAAGPQRDRQPLVRPRQHRIPNPQTGSARLLTLERAGRVFRPELRLPRAAPDRFNVTHWSDRGDARTGALRQGRPERLPVPARPRGVADRRSASGRSSVRAVTLSARHPEAPVPRPQAEDQEVHQHRAFPFTSVTVVDDTTPILDEPRNSKIPGLNDRSAAFWPRVGGRDYLWTLAATDVEGIRVEFQAPLILVKNATSTTGGSSGTRRARADRSTILDYYLDDARAPQRERPFGGQSVAYAPSIPGKARQTAFATEMFELGAILPQAGATPRFAPAVPLGDDRDARARRGDAAVAGTEGGARAFDPKIRVKPAQAYVELRLQIRPRTRPRRISSTAEKVALDYTKDARRGRDRRPRRAEHGAGGALEDPRPAGRKSQGRNAAGPQARRFPQGREVPRHRVHRRPARERSRFPDPTSPNYAATAAKVPRTLTETIYEGGTGQLARKIPKEIRTEFVWEPELKGNGVFIANGPEWHADGDDAACAT